MRLAILCRFFHRRKHRSIFSNFWNEYSACVLRNEKINSNAATKTIRRKILEVFSPKIFALIKKKKKIHVIELLIANSPLHLYVLRFHLKVDCSPRDIFDSPRSYKTRSIVRFHFFNSRFSQILQSDSIFNTYSILPISIYIIEIHFQIL